MEYQNFKSTTLSADLAAGETSSATLSAANFTNFTDGYLVLDYDNPTKREVVRCTVTGTAVSAMTRGQDGTSDVAHTSGAKVIWALTAVHLNQFASGWIQCNEAWAYASPTTITVPTGATAKYSVGDKIRFKQTAGTYVYFYVTAVATTVLTVTGGTDYTVADETITDNYYSKASSPVGFPDWFAYSPTLVNSSGVSSRSSNSKFKIEGKNILVIFTEGFAQTGTSANMGISMPVANNFGAEVDGFVRLYRASNDGSIRATNIGNGSTTLLVMNAITSGNESWTNTTFSIVGQIFYQI